MVTLKEIAEKLGISVTTVSKALKEYPDVSKRTRKLVRETASMLNYKPNSFAVNLRTKESKTIGLIIPEIVHHFFSSVIKGIISQAEKKGYLVITLQSNESYELEKKQIDLLISKRVDGILISLANGTGDYKHLTEIIENDTPLVMFDKIAKVVKCSKVIIDDFRKASLESYDLILCNPPYFKKGDGRVSSDSQKQVCRTFETGSSVELIQTILKSLNPGGMGVIVYPYNLNHWKECKEKFKENIKVLQRSGKVEFSLIIKSDLN